MIPILIVLTLLIVLNGLFVVAEYAVARLRNKGVDAGSLSRRTAPFGAAEGNGAKEKDGLIARLTDPVIADPTAFLAATQLGITMSSLAIGWFAADMLAILAEDLSASQEWFRSLRDAGTDLTSALEIGRLAAFVVIFGGLTLLHSVFAEIIPKTFAWHRPLLALRMTAGPLRLFAFVALPAVRIVDFMAGLLLRLVGMRRVPAGEHHSTSDLQNIVDQSRRSGEIDPTSHELISKVFTFRHRTVRQIMVARPQIVALEASAPKAEIMRTCIEEGFSRVPVYEGSLDNIVGVVYAKDLLGMVEHNNLIILHDLMRPPFFVAESKGISELLREFQQRRLHLAIVVDEFGGTAGLVTMEDIIEELVGEIQDEFDHEEPPVRESGDGEFTVKASAAISDANRFLPQALPEGEQYDTVGGFINVLFEKIPDLNETRHYGDYELTVVAKKRRTIETVLLRHLPSADNSTPSVSS